MKFNKWTVALAAGGVVSLGSVVQAEEAAQNQVLTALSQTTLSGYVDTSAIWNFNNGNAVPGRSFDGPGKQDGFNLNVVKISLEKPMSEDQWSAGYKVDLLYGPDANVYGTTSTGPAGRVSDFAIKNAHVALRAPVGNGIDFKIGFWDSIIGYEVFEAGNNPNYSRSYGYAIEPKQHTGVLATYHVSDAVGVSVGVANTGNNNIINSRSGHDTLKSYMASISVTAPESTGFLAGSVLYAGIIDSGIDGADDVLNYYVGAAIPTPLEALSVGAAWDLRSDAIAPGSDEYAIGVYASYQASEKLKLNARGEYARASDDGAVAPFLRGLAGSGLQKVWGATLTADYSLWENVLTRAELRYDKADDFVPGRGFSTGTKDDVISLALNVIYKF